MLTFGSVHCLEGPVELIFHAQGRIPPLAGFPFFGGNLLANSIRPSSPFLPAEPRCARDNFLRPTTSVLPSEDHGKFVS